MKTLLRIDASPKFKNSITKLLADYFEENWRSKNPSGQIIRRDLASTQIPHIDNNTIQGFYTPKEHMTQELINATSLSDELIAEIKTSDELLISSPLYNLTVPSNLKAYIDQVMRINKTFSIDENGSHGLLNGRKAYLITAKGGIMKDTEMEKYDFQEPYLKAILYYMGIETDALFSLEGTAHEDLLDKNTEEMKKIISKHFKTEYKQTHN